MCWRAEPTQKQGKSLSKGHLLMPERHQADLYQPLSGLGPLSGACQALPCLYLSQHFPSPSKERVERARRGHCLPCLQHLLCCTTFMCCGEQNPRCEHCQPCLQRLCGEGAGNALPGHQRLLLSVLRSLCCAKEVASSLSLCNLH